MDDVTTRSDTQKILQQPHTFDADSLTDLVHRAGLTVVDRGTIFMKPFTHRQMADMMAAGLLTERVDEDGVSHLAPPAYLRRATRGEGSSLEEIVEMMSAGGGR